MRFKKIKKLKAWFTSDFSLEEIGEALKQLGLITDFQFDYENVYEWIEAETLNKDQDFNLSRKHCYDENSGDEDSGQEPIRVFIMYRGQEPSDEIIEEFAMKTAEHFECTVSLGYIRNRGDEFEYRSIAESKFKCNPSPPLRE